MPGRPIARTADRTIGPGGFTLLEVLVAFVIAALALGVLFDSAGGGLRATQASDRYVKALSHARSHLAAIGAGGVVVAGEQSGEDGGGFRWRSRVTRAAAVPLGGDPVAGPQTPRLVQYAVEVRVEWDGEGGRRNVTLTSERLGISAPPPP